MTSSPSPTPVYMSSEDIFPINDAGAAVLPDANPLRLGSSQPVSSPVVRTPESRRWVGLDNISPKLLREIQRQHDSSVHAERTGALSKSASKIKAWARQSKLGIDIRLRRKINAEHDEVTDIRLVPDRALPQLDKPDISPIAELPTSQDEIPELPDNHMVRDLGSGQQQPSSRGRLDDPYYEEPLPRYEPTSQSSNHSRSAASPAGDAPGSAGENSRLPTETLDQPASTRTSTISAPAQDLSLHYDPRSPSNVETMIAINEEGGITQTHAGPERDVIAQLESTLHGTQKQLSQSLQRLVREMELGRSASQKEGNPDLTRSDPTSVGQGFLDGLKVMDATTYETEPVGDSPSPTRRDMPGSVTRKKSALQPRRKKSVATQRRTKSSSRVAQDDCDFENGSWYEAGATPTLSRKPTLPKQTRAKDGPEAIWKSLLAIQAKILGPEHPLVYQAKSDMSMSRANGHVSADFSALRQSESLAIETLGSVHPWVAGFSETIDTLLGVTAAEVTESSLKRTGSARARPETPSPSGLTKSRSDSEVAPGSPAESHGQDSNSENSTFEDAEVLKSGVHSDLKLPHEDRSDHFSGVEQSRPLDDLWNVSRPPHPKGSTAFIFGGLVLRALTKELISGLHWLQKVYGPEPEVEPGKIRVRWTCSCGEPLYDDFIERRPGAARELEAFLNRPQVQIRGDGTMSSSSNSFGSQSFGSSTGAPPSTSTTWSSFGYPSESKSFNADSKAPKVSTGMPMLSPFSPLYEPPWLLTCANEERFTPKLAHLDMSPHKIRSDKDLATALREHYFQLNRKWWRALRLRGLSTIEFVQFEVHQNRYADIRKCPSMPAVGSDYSFEPGDLLPPVGSSYLLHLFRHPQDYDGELITYLRAPKKTGRLQLGVGWGINLVEGFLADRVWMLLSTFFALGSLVFAVVWTWKKHDIQGAFGVAAWMLTFLALAGGWMHACFG